MPPAVFGHLAPVQQGLSKCTTRSHLADIDSTNSGDLIMAEAAEDAHGQDSPTNWKELSSDAWILQTVQGYRIEFDSTPLQLAPPRPIQTTRADARLIDAELRELRSKGAIQPAPDATGFYSNIFLVRKKTVEFRPVINLGELNSHVKLNIEGTPSGLDCSDIWQRNHTARSGVYTVKPIGANTSFEVFCEMTSAVGGWTLIQSHNGNNQLSFDRTWHEYKEGFGHSSGEQWLGLEKIYWLTNQAGRPSELLVVLGDFGGSTIMAFYNQFKIGPEYRLYQLSLGKYIGNAGDAFRGRVNGDGNNQDGSFFSTVDNDNDKCDPCVAGGIMYNSCARDRFYSGWWFNRCGIANLNGNWHPENKYKGWSSSLKWETWSLVESMKFSKMYAIH
ncbi:fibrinogen-like protein 1 [Pelobates fuscus]|uniref:fibrinogen-like protein 1 n=1 Tax=Pelobates fuscus TaxID=191477 RepID=UPI002FE47B2C